MDIAEVPEDEENVGDASPGLPSKELEDATSSDELSNIELAPKDRYFQQCMEMHWKDGWKEDVEAYITQLGGLADDLKQGIPLLRNMIRPSKKGLGPRYLRILASADAVPKPELVMVLKEECYCVSVPCVSGGEDRKLYFRPDVVDDPRSLPSKLMARIFFLKTLATFAHYVKPVTMDADRFKKLKRAASVSFQLDNSQKVVKPLFLEDGTRRGILITRSSEV